MADEQADFYRIVFKLISSLRIQNKITEESKGELKKLLLEDEEFLKILKEEYNQNGLKGLEEIIIEDTISNCSFRDLIDCTTEKRKRSQSLTIQTDSSE